MSDTAKIQKELERVKLLARAKKVEADAARDEGKAEGYDFLDPQHKDGFDKIDSLYKEASTLSQRSIELSEMLAKVAGWDREEKSDPDPEANGFEQKTGKPESLAKKFMASAEYKAALPEIKNWEPGSKINMRPVTLFEGKTVLDLLREQKSLITGASATSGGAFVTNDIQGMAGYNAIPFAPNRVIDLVGQRTTDSDTVEYVDMTSRTNNAAEAAEATSGSDGALAESTAAWAVRTVAVSLFGHHLFTTGRALEDESELEGMLRDDLIGGLLRRLDSQLLNGNGTPPNIEGILNASNVNSQALGSDSRSDAIHKAMTVVRIDSNVQDAQFLEPDGVALHPTDFQSIRLEKDANGNYIYGPPSQPGPTAIWGVPVVQSLSLSQGTGLVGSYANAARLWMRRGVTVSVSENYSDYFIRDILTLKATARLAFKAVRPDAFSKVTGL